MTNSFFSYSRNGSANKVAYTLKNVGVTIADVIYFACGCNEWFSYSIPRKKIFQL